MATEPIGSIGSMGLRGTWASVANLSAVALLGLLVWVDRLEFHRQAREDRTIFVSTLKEIRSDSTRQWEAVRGLAEDVRTLAREIRDLQKEQQP